MTTKLDTTEHTYAGDSGDHACVIIRQNALTVSIKITGHDSPSCTVPIGAVITVPIVRIV